MRARVSRQFDTNSGTRPIIHVREVLEASTRITCVLLLSEERREKKHKLYIISLLVSVQVKTAWTTRRSYDSYNIYRTHTERSEWSRRISLKNAFRYYRRSMRSCAHFFFLCLRYIRNQLIICPLLSSITVRCVTSSCFRVTRRNTCNT